MVDMQFSLFHLLFQFAFILTASDIFAQTYMTTCNWTSWLEKRNEMDIDQDNNDA